ncbi:hypothetical protein M8J76_004207 [Diaphorina citri]|nr:hypothetical protein M8J76_004207 [Diaphorina citri]
MERLGVSYNYMCFTCEYHTNNNHNMLRHVRKHLELICQHCRKHLLRRTDVLLDHSLICERSDRPDFKRLYMCYSCKYSTSQRSHMKRHICAHIGDKPFRCQLCNKGYVEQSSLNRHKILHADTLLGE